MIVVPKDLYEYLRKVYNQQEVFLCDLHKPCKNKRLCNMPSNSILFINFDDIKEKNSEKRNTTPPSVDGLSYVKNKLVLMEMKSWKDYLLHTENVNRDSIENKVFSYKLSEKFFTAVRICSKNMTEEEKLNFWAKNEVIYVFVTDLDKEQNRETALNSFVANLNQLSQSASFEKLCKLFSIKKMELVEKEINNNQDFAYIKNIKTFYKSCHELDEFVQGIC